MTLAAGGERYVYYEMNLFFPLPHCPSFHCFRFVPALMTTLVPLPPSTAFVVTGFVAEVLAGVMLWLLVERLRGSRRMAALACGWFWAVWGPAFIFREPLLIADPLQVLWSLTALFLLIENRYVVALPLLIAGAAVKESVLLVPMIYAAYLVLAGEDLRGKRVWSLVLMAAPLIAWRMFRAYLIGTFGYVPPGDAQYVTRPYTLGLWFQSLGEWPRNVWIASLYVVAACGAAWVFGVLGLRHADRRQRALTLASLPPMIFLALYQEPHRAIANFPWALLIPAAIYVAPLPLPLTCAILLVNAAFSIRMSAAVPWIPRAPLLLVVLLPFVAAAVYMRSRRRDVSTGAADTGPAIRWVVAATVAGLIVLTSSLTARRLAEPMLVEHVPGPAPESVVVADDDGGIPGLAVSGDGDQLVFTGAEPVSTGWRLWIRRTGSARAEALEGTDGATAPFWSPDDRVVGFFAAGKLKTVDVRTREIRVVADAASGHSGAWGRGDTIVFAADPPEVLHQVNAAGGGVTDLTRADPARRDRAHRSPAFFPDGVHFLFVSRDATGNDRQLLIGSLASPSIDLLLDGSASGVFAQPQFVFYEWDRGLWAMSFEPGRFQRFGLPARISRRLALAPRLDRMAVSASRGGLAFAAVRASSGAATSITVVHQWRRGLWSIDSP